MPSHTLSRCVATTVVLCTGALLVSAQDATKPENAAVPALMASQQADAKATGLTLEECVARALLKNFDLKIQGFNTEIAKENLTIAKADYVPAFTATAKRSGASSYLTGALSDDSQARVGVSQKITTGAIVDVTTGLDRGHGTATSTSSYLSYFNPAYNADVSVAVSQPLLKNAGTAVNRAAIERAKIGMNRAGLDFKGSVLLVVRDVETAYYNLCAAREQLTVRKSSLQLAQTLFDEAKSRKQAGVATDLDVLQAEVGVSDARRNVILSEQIVHDGEDALLNLIGQFEFNSPVGDIRFPEYNEPAPSFDVSYKLARNNQPDLLSAQASIKQFEIDATTSKNGRLPQLDLGGALGYNTVESSAHRAINELPNSNGYNWELDLTFRMPWGLKAERARYRSAMSTLNQVRARVQQLEQNLMVQVRSAVRSVEANIESVNISTQSTGLSVKKYELEKARFDAGLSTARFVLQAQDELETARVSELQAKVTLRNAIADLRRLEGSGMERFKIVLPQ